MDRDEPRGAGDTPHDPDPDAARTAAPGDFPVPRDADRRELDREELAALAGIAPDVEEAADVIRLIEEDDDRR